MKESYDKIKNEEIVREKIKDRIMELLSEVYAYILTHSSKEESEVIRKKLNTIAYHCEIKEILK